MTIRHELGCFGWLLAVALTAQGGTLVRGTVKFEPLEDQAKLPEPYRLEAHDFTYEQADLENPDPPGAKYYSVRYPSPIETRHPENNRVYAEFLCPPGEGPFPAVVLLDIMQGNAVVCRLQAGLLARKGIASLFVQMPYYGERRPIRERIRMISPDLEHTKRSVRQAVLDVRRGAAWLASRPEVSGKSIGIMGTSLGSFLAALSAAMEPRLERAAILLGGGGLVETYYHDERAKLYRMTYEALGGKKETLVELLAPLDPLTYAERLKQRKLLFIAGSHDEVVLPQATKALWKATGEQPIHWYPATHVGMALFMPIAMQRVVDHFKP
jgi:dienelactone hydrolase